MNLLSAIFIGAALSLSTPAPAQNSDWPTFRANASQTGIAACELPAKLDLLWTYESKALISSSPVIDADTVFVGTEKGKLLALDLATGTFRWEYVSGSAIKAAPALLGGKVFVGDNDGIFHAVNARDGSRLWTYKTDGQIISSGNFFTQDTDARVLFGSYDQNLYCLSAKSGKGIWKFETNGPVHCSPCIMNDTVVISGCDAQLRAINLVTGKQEKTLELSSNVASSPVSDGERIYVSTYDGHVLCADMKHFKKLWDRELQNVSFYASPALAKNEAIFAGRDGVVRACSRESDGSDLWTFRAKGKIDSSPAIAGNRVFFGSSDGSLYALNINNGKKLWSFEAGAPISSSPAIANGRLIICAEDGAIYCFGAAGEKK